MFTDRTQAAGALAAKLLPYRQSIDLVVGLARGGVVISHAIAHTLGLPHLALRVKKIGSPNNPELAVGAEVPKGQRIPVSGKSVVVADDGMATGETMMAAVSWIRNKGAKKITIAVPVAPQETIDRLRPLVDEIIVLATPSNFEAVGAFYTSFPQISDEEVVQLLK